MAPLKDSERRDFLEICDDRYQRRSIILTSQLPIAHWHEQIGDPSVADSILDGWSTMLFASNSPGNPCATNADGNRRNRHPERGFYSAEWGKGTQTRSPCPTPIPARRRGCCGRACVLVFDGSAMGRLRAEATT